MGRKGIGIKENNFSSSDEISQGRKGLLPASISTKLTLGRLLFIC